MNKPLVSICIPTYNRAQYLAQAIESALNQDYEHVEVIVADNCSDDNTDDVVKQFMADSRFSYCRNAENIGAVNNIKGLLNEKAAGQWFLILSDDDYLLDSSYITKAMHLVEKQPQINMIYSNGYIEHTTTNTMQKLEIPFQSVTEGIEVFLKMHMVKPQPFTLCNILFNTALAKQLQAFSNPFNYSCDSELFLKMCLFGKVGLVKDFVSVYRWHGSNATAQKRTFEELIAIATDLYIAPHVMAKEMGIISAADMDKRKITLVIPELKNILFCISVIDSKLIKNAVSRLDGKGVDIQRFFRDPVFLLKIYLTKCPALFNFIRDIKKILSR